MKAAGCITRSTIPKRWRGVKTRYFLQPLQNDASTGRRQAGHHAPPVERRVLCDPGGAREAGFGRGHPLHPAHVLPQLRSEEHTSELQSLMRISYAVFCLKNKI